VAYRVLRDYSCVIQRWHCSVQMLLCNQLRAVIHSASRGNPCKLCVIRGMDIVYDCVCICAGKGAEMCLK
jgi:hypothetical protein